MLDGVYDKVGWGIERPGLKTVLFTDSKSILGEEKENWREIKSVEPYFEGIWSENICELDSDYFEEPK